MTLSKDRVIVVLIALAASVVAAVSAIPYAASANDGSRLAAVESLVDHHTLAIDDSIYVQPPPLDSPPQQLPYMPRMYWLPEHGTIDKVRVNGRFYSHQPQVQSVLMAGVYQVLQWTIGLRARDRADLFCYLMTLTSSGLAYVLAVTFTYSMGRTLGLTCGWSVALCASLGLATIALPYVRQVNSHIVLLAVAMPLFARLADATHPASRTSLVLLGSLAGLGYALEQATGLLMLAGTFGVLFLRRPRASTVLLAGVGALPWVALHHALTFAVGGTFGPIATVPEYFDYPDSAFDATNLTGHWHHANLWSFLYYAGGLIFGNRGFLQSDLPLLLMVPAVPFLLRDRRELRLEVLFAFGLCVLTWLVYAALSNNYSGECCSIRWFVPLLAPGYFLLALVLREYPARRLDFLLLSGGGMVLAAVMWWGGTWGSDIPAFWPITCATMAAWLTCLYLAYRRRPRRDFPTGEPRV